MPPSHVLLGLGCALSIERRLWPPRMVGSRASSLCHNKRCAGARCSPDSHASHIASPPDDRCFFFYLWRSLVVRQWAATFAVTYVVCGNGSTGEERREAARIALPCTVPHKRRHAALCCSQGNQARTAGGAGGAEGVRPLTVLRWALRVLCALSASHACDLAARAAHSNEQILEQILLSRSKYSVFDVSILLSGSKYS